MSIDELRLTFELEMKRQQRDVTRQGESYRDHGVGCMWWAAKWGHAQKD